MSVTGFRKLHNLILPIVVSTSTLALALLLLAVVMIAQGPAAQAQTFSVVHTFTGPEGANPEAGVTIRGGNLFGTTYGVPNFGTVYELVHSGSNWSALPLYIFSNGDDGANPRGRVIFDPNGHPWGTARFGGSFNDGVIFDLTPPLTVCKTANCFWKENPVSLFGSGLSTPGYGDLVWDAQGNIYGTTDSFLGGVYELTRTENGWMLNPLYKFSGTPDGSAPEGGVIFDNNGNLYGTTRLGGLFGYGTVFKMSYTVGVGWTETPIYNFQGDTDGSAPYAGLVFDSAGNLYGTTSAGGSERGGTIFELSPSGDTWTFQLLQSFPSGEGGPYAPLTIDSSGNLYGTTRGSGTNNCGNVFKLTRAGDNWTYASLYDFTCGTDGGFPISNVTIDTDGTLYGTAEYQGGPKNYGVIWMIKP